MILIKSIQSIQRATLNSAISDLKHRYKILLRTKASCTSHRVTASALLLSTLIVSGCASNPYILSKQLKSSIPATSTITFAGDLDKAIADVDKQRSAYFNELKNRTVQRNLLSGSLIGLSAGALYQGVTSSAGAGGRSVANLGAAAGGAYTLGNYSNNPPTELAYINAFNDLTCLVMRTRPWLVTTPDYNAFTTTVINLRTATDALDRLYQKQAAKSGDSVAFVKKQRFERQMLYNARVTLRQASNFQGFVETAGFQLRQEALLASNAANFEIHRNQPDLANPSVFIASLRSTSQAFRDIKPLEPTPADAQKNINDDGDKNDAPPTEQSSSNSSKSTNTAISSSTSTSSTAASELGKQADAVEAKLKALEASAAKDKAANKKQADTTRDDIKKLTADFAVLKKQLSAIQTNQTTTLSVSLSMTDSISLAHALSDLLNAMRPVNATLSRAYSLKPYVKSIPECQPQNGLALEFAFDSDETTLQQGQTFDVALKGGVGIPRIWLSGAKSNDKNEMPKLVTVIEGGIARAQLTLLPTTPEGVMHIMAVDGSGKQRDDIKVIVVAAPKKVAL